MKRSGPFGDPVGKDGGDPLRVSRRLWPALPEPVAVAAAAVRLKNEAVGTITGAMDFGLYISASGMVAEQARESQVANNLANATTPGYKPSEANVNAFGRLLLDNTATGQPVGNFDLGVETGPEYVDLVPAAVHETGRPLDFAIEGEGFFAVRTAAGVRYTRGGQFMVNAEGILTDPQGNPVLSQALAPIRVGANGR